MDHFIDLGAGWFLFDDESSSLTVVCDAYGGEQTRHFGPAAWGGMSGPVSGRPILEAMPVPCIPQHEEPDKEPNYGPEISTLVRMIENGQL